MANRYSQDNYTVPSLSLASSRSKRTIPTKDTTGLDFPSSTKSRHDIMDRLTKNAPYNTTVGSSTGMSRPPIFKAKSKEQGSSNIQGVQNRMENDNPYQLGSSNPRPNQPAFNANLNRNVYLQRETGPFESSTKKQENTYEQIQPATFRPRESQRSQGSTNLLRNPSSSRTIQAHTEKQIQFKKVDVNKSLFERRMAKLFQQADFYEKELNDMYSDQNMEELEQSIKELEMMKKDAFKFRDCIGAAIV